MLGKGFCISPQGHTLNLLADYTSQGDFHTGGIRLANLYHWLPAGKKLELSLTYTSRIGRKAIRQRAESYTKTTIGSAIFHTRGMATRPTLAQETVSQNRRFPSKKQTNKESGQQCQPALYRPERERRMGSQCFILKLHVHISQ